MTLKTVFRRARRGLREDLRLYLVAVSSLTVAFISLTGALVAVQNLELFAKRWGETGRLSIYLKDDASAQDVSQLRSAISALSEVADLQHLTSEAARQQFFQEAKVGAEFSELPLEVFPSSLEVVLVAGVSTKRVRRIASKVGQFHAVDSVETYLGWFDRIAGLVSAVRVLAAFLIVVVLLCVAAVVGNTIRLAIASRRGEIEVMKLCGATDNFVRGPFLMEGAIQGGLAALFAVLFLFAGYIFLHGEINEALHAFTGIRLVFVSVPTVIGILFAGVLLGGLGSFISLRRYLSC
ncbi:MAG: permease-like cell division protein FtsX [Myxococcota bacterium]